MKKSLFSLYTFLLTLIFTLCSVAGWGQISMTTTSSYSQDFNTLKTSGTTNDWSNNSTLSNWYAANFNNSYVADNGSGNAGGIKSYGTATNIDRALGSLGSSQAAPYYGVQFRNNSTSAITDFKVAYTGEQWRKADNATKHKLYFSYKITSSSDIDLISGTWSSVPALDFEGPIASSLTATTLDGNSSSNRNVIPATALSSISIPAGSYIMLRWNDINESGSDHGLAIDDVTVSWAVSPTSTVIITAQDPNSSPTNWNAGSSNNIFYYAALTPTGGNATLSSVKANMTGSYLAADIANNGFKLYYSADFDFTPAGDALLGAVSSAKSGATETLTWSSLTQAITASSTGYIYAVADVASSATDGRTVAGTFTGNSNIVFSPTVTYSASNTYGSTVNKTIVNTSPQLQYENGNNLNFGNVCINTTASSTGSFDLYGLNLTGNVTVGALSGYSYSTTSSGTYIPSLTLSPDGGGDLAETIYVRFTPTLAQSYSGNIAISGGGATAINVAVSGTGINGTPLITTNAASLVVNTTARLNGNYSTAATCYSITERGFIYARTADNNNPTNPAVNGTTVFKVPVGNGTGGYNTNLTGLMPSSGYSYVAYVTDGTNYFYGAVQTFTTLGVATQIAFNPAPPATGNTNANLTTFKVEARRADNTVDTEYTGTVTLTKNSGPGNIQGTVSFNAVAGVATFSAVQFDAAGTYTIRAASGSFTNIVSGNIVISTLSAATDFFRSRSAGPNDWNAAGSWESSPNAAGPWITATRYPDEDASGVEIRAGHTININTSDIYITNTKVFGVLKVTTSSPFFIEGTTDGIELEIENGGVLDVSNTGYVSYASASFGLVKTGGKIIANPGADALYFLYDYLDYDDGKFYFADNAIAEWNLESYPPTSNDYDYGIYNDNIIFPYPNNSGAMPIFRISNISSNSSYGYGSTANPSTINAKLELNTTKTFNIHNNNNQKSIYILGGISGQGTINQFGTASQPGQLILGDATTMPTLGGNINLKMISSRLKLPNGANIPSGANVLIERNASTDQNGIIDKSGGSININGVLDISNMRIQNATAGNVSVNGGGTLRTRNTGGLFGTGSAIPGGTVNINSGSTIEYYATLDQSISSGKDYYNIIFSGAGTKTPGNNINVHTDGSVTITGTPIIDFSSSNLASTEANNTKFTMDGGRLILGTAELLPNMGGVYKITGGTIEFSNNADRIRTPNTFNNIEISVPAGKQVTYAGGNLTLNPNSTVLVKPNATLTSTNGNASLVGTSNNTLKLEPDATFRTAVIPGFYGPAASGLNPSPSVRNNITLDLDPGSIVEYARLSGSGGLPAGALSGEQQIVPLANGYPNLQITGNGTKTVMGNVVVNNSTSVTSGSATLEIQETADTESSSVLTAKKGVRVIYGQAIFKNNAQLMQDVDAVNVGSIKVERTLKPRRKDGLYSALEYNYFSAPVADQMMNAIYGGDPANAQYVLVLDEPNNKFINAKTDDYLVKGKGFAVKEPSKDFVQGETAVTATFKGVPNNATLKNNDQEGITITRKSIGLGWNLIGNPYPSNIDLKLLYEDNISKMLPEFRFWDNRVNNTYVQYGGAYSGYSYAFYNAASDEGNPAPTGDAGNNTGTPGDPGTEAGLYGIAKVGQGFLVRASNVGSAKVIFSNTQRTVEQPARGFFGRSASAKDRYRIQLITPANLNLTTTVVYFNGGNNGFGLEDSRHPSNTTSDALFTFAQTDRTIINGRAPFGDTDVITVGTRHFVQGVYKIRAVDMIGVFKNGQHIYLKDKLLNTMTDLTSGDYTFTSDAGEFTNRFEIVYRPSPILTTESFQKEQLIVYRDGNDYVVKSMGKKIIQLETYDGAGRAILKLQPNSTQVRINGDLLNNGLYILKIHRDDEVSTKKILK
ncbi:MAG: hypothetical protein BGO40_06855 [Chryseobacterium sp. 39-10]|nr:MAG: hypothetical protein BGO40_06855 [Chryseobacterium sp. 39-10]